jgi:iron complex outermembrane recepter protein
VRCIVSSVVPSVAVLVVSGLLLDPGLHSGVVRADDVTGSAAGDVSVAVDDMEQWLKRPIAPYRRLATLEDTAGAVFVITREDIRRSGATTLPDVLRMVPGVEVARANDNDAYVSIRGFNEETENKLLVLVDGRTIYSSVFSGVFWYEQDFLLDEIERIEVLRGPGASVWGANAVNGVINIITCRSKDQLGGRVAVSGGTFDRLITSARYGATLGKHGYSACWAKFFDRDQLDSSRNAETLTASDWDSVLLGARYDWDPPDPHRFSLRSGWHRTGADDKFVAYDLTPPYRTVDAYRREGTQYYLSGDYESRFSEDSVGAVQMYYDYDRNDYGNGEMRYETFDIDSQVSFPLGDRHDVVCGAGYRLLWDDIEIPLDTGTTFFNPSESTRSLYTLFVEDELEVLADLLYLQAGCKVERNAYSGWEWQPNVRFRLKPVKDHTFWGAVSRAVRTPSRLDSDTSGSVSSAPGTLLEDDRYPVQWVIVEGDPDSETLIAYELGYRAQLSSNAAFDVSVFYNDYDKLRTYRMLSDGYELSAEPVSHYQLLLAPDSAKKGRSYGGELSAWWQVLDNWKLIAGYAFIDIETEISDSSSIDIAAVTGIDGKSPEHSFSLRSQWDVTPKIDCDIWLRHVDELPALDVDAYTTVDVRLAWRPRRDIELSLVGRDLVDESHQEFRWYEVERSVYARLAWEF